MARHTFGGSISDWSFTFNTDGTVSQAAGAVLTFWDSLSGGDQYLAAPMPGGVDDGTGLLDGTGVPISSVTTDGNGEIPDSIQGPDEVYRMAADGSGNGTGPRRWITANDMGDDLVTLLNAVNLPAAPTYVFFSNALASYPSRPAATGAVWWVGPIAPPVGGTTGATGADVWLNTTGAAAPGGVASVGAGDASIQVGGSGSAPTVKTGTLDQIAGLHPAAAAWGNGGFQIHNVGAGVASGDVATVGQIYPVGDASDGAATLDGTATYSGFTSKSGSTYTLTRDVFATTLTVNSGVTLVTGGYRIFATVSVTNNGTIQDLGGNASGATAGTGSAGTLRAGGAGGAGASGNGAQGSSPAGSVGVGTGGTGGAGSGKTGGTGQAVSLAANWPFKLPNSVLAGMALAGPGATGNTVVPSGGVGGGAGGGDATNSGGGGGSGGGIIAILAPSVINTGTISVAGGNGGTPPTGNCGGGGGGGGGIIVIYTVQAWANSGTTNVNGGNPGSGVGTGAAGTAGGTGSVLNVVLA